MRRQQWTLNHLANGRSGILRCSNVSTGTIFFFCSCPVTGWPGSALRGKEKKKRFWFFVLLLLVLPSGTRWLVGEGPRQPSTLGSSFFNTKLFARASPSWNDFFGLKAPPSALLPPLAPLPPDRLWNSWRHCSAAVHRVISFRRLSASGANWSALVQVAFGRNFRRNCVCRSWLEHFDDIGKWMASLSVEPDKNPLGLVPYSMEYHKNYHLLHLPPPPAGHHQQQQQQQQQLASPVASTSANARSSPTSDSDGKVLHLVASSFAYANWSDCFGDEEFHFEWLAVSLSNVLGGSQYFRFLLDKLNRPRVLSRHNAPGGGTRFAFGRKLCARLFGKNQKSAPFSSVARGVLCPIRRLRLFQKFHLPSPGSLQTENWTFNLNKFRVRRRHLSETRGAICKWVWMASVEHSVGVTNGGVRFTVALFICRFEIFESTRFWPGKMFWMRRPCDVETGEVETQNANGAVGSRAASKTQGGGNLIN